MAEPYLAVQDPGLIRPGLSRCTALLEKLGNPQNRLCYVHVAGTNGKGSVSACIASILQCAGLKTGLFTSPALERFSERVKVDGEEIPEADLQEISQEVAEQAAELPDPPTEFEQATALALLYFARRGCDIAVLEVGLGGSEDATNVIPTPEVAVITAMGLDHTGILGNGLEEIAAAKAGILKPGTVLVNYGNEPACNTVFAETCRRLDIPEIRVDCSRIGAVHLALEGSRCTIVPYGELQLALTGEYQINNALMAITAVEALINRGWQIDEAAIRKGLAEVCWPGRFEVLHRDPTIILDGSHNPMGLSATLNSVGVLLQEKPVVLIGVMADKDVDGMLDLLVPAAHAFVAVTAPNKRAMDAKALAEKIRKAGGQAMAADSIAEGVNMALDNLAQGRALFALGTLYFSAAVRRSVAERFGEG